MGYSWEDDTGTSGGGAFRSGATPDFRSAREAYTESPSKHRSFSGPRPSERTSERSDRASAHRAGAKFGPPPVGRELATDSTHPLVIGPDHTGSMREKPELIFERLSLLGKEVERYAPGYAISFFAIGDARYDTYALQVTDFNSGPPLDQELLKIKGEGGGQDDPESYGLPAYYYLHHCHMPKAVKPVFIMILDDLPHPEVRKSEILKFTGDDAQGDLDTMELFRQLQKKFSVYIVLFGERDSSDFKAWAEIVGGQRVIPIEEERDIIEVMIGIYAGEMGAYEDFEMRSSRRHSDRPDRVSRVGESLKSVKEKSKAASVGDVAIGVSAGKSGKSLKSKKLV